MGQKIHTEYAIGPKVEPKTISLLNGHNNKQPSKFASLHS